MKKRKYDMECSAGYCGGCCWMRFEDTDGWGYCDLRACVCSESVDAVHCSDLCTVDGGFVSEDEKRHHMAVLIQANRYRRDDNVPSIYKMPNPTELGRAIDFAVKYLKNVE